MQRNSIDIETIVRLVVERLRANSAEPAPATGVPASLPAKNPVASPPSQALGYLRLEEKIVSFDRLDGRLEGVSVVQVPSRAVITPLVFDELRRRKIRIERQSTSPPVHASSFDGSRLLVIGPTKRSEVDFPGQIIIGTQSCSADAGRIAAHINGGGKSAIWAADRPYAATMAAAGNSCLRAVQLFKLTELTRALAEVEPNVFIVDGLTWSASEVSELALSMLNGDGTQSPGSGSSI